MNPYWIPIGVLILLNVVGVPWAFFGSSAASQTLFAYARYASRQEILHAYWWTVYGTVALVAVSAMLGTIRAMKMYQRVPMELPGPAVLKRLWWCLFFLGWAAVVVMFVQAGYTVPWIAAGAATFASYTDSATLRSHFDALITPSLYNGNLLFVATGAVVLSFVCMKRRALLYRLASVLLFVTSASFSLAKSQLAGALFIVVVFVALAHRVRIRTTVVAAAALLACVLPFYLVLAYATTVGDAITQLVARTIFGQWAGLPYYFTLFDGRPQPFASLLPPYLQRPLGLVVDSPGRKIMLFMEPQAALSGVAGNVPSFFVGEAFAVGGTLGALISPAVVAFELWLLAICFLRLPKSPLVVLLFSWFLYKFTMGVAGGFSAFLVSSFTFLLAVLVAMVIAREGSRVRAFA